MDPKEEIKQRLDIAEVIGEYLTLKPAGAGSFKALCPFHQEKTPSLYVSKEKQIWHCFGCDVGGDIFSFVMEIENTDFPEALRILAKKAGVKVPRFSKSESNERQRLVAINELAAKFYKKILASSSAAANARSYLEARGINKELLDDFEIGYAPDTWDTLTNFLGKRGFSAWEMEQSGLIQRKKTGPGFIDRFRSRVMIPLRDHHGNTVGFTGRILGRMTEKTGPKYMNSPETLIYKKSELLFGLDLAKTAIKENRSVIIVEGNLDVVASHKAGVKNVVASSGTALTEQQVNLLKRYTNNFVFSFDQDAAGFDAAKRGIRLAQVHDCRVEVATLPAEAGKDPDEAVQKNPKLWQNAVSNTVPIMNYYFNQAVKNKDLNKVDDKRAVGRFLIPEIASITDLIEQEHWLQKLSDLVRVEIEILRKMILEAKDATPQQNNNGAKQPKKALKRSRHDQATLAILGIFISVPELRNEIIENLKSNEISSTELKTLYKELTLAYNSDRTTSAQKSFFAEFRNKLSNDPGLKHLTGPLDEAALSGECTVAETPPNMVQGQLKEYLDVITQGHLGNRKKELEMAIRQAEELGDTDAVKKLIEEYNTL